MRPLIIINKGDKYGRLTIVKELERTYNIHNKLIRKVECICDCGNIKHFILNEIRRGKTKSCGCFKNEIQKISNLKHGDKPINSKYRYLYNTWIGIKARCYNPNHKKYKYYGGEGKFLNTDWIKNYTLFKQWILENIGERPDGYTLDRKNGDLGYIPGNLRWASSLEQNNNRRKKIHIDTKRN